MSNKSRSLVKEKYSATKGYRICMARKAMGLTQMELAQQVNTTQQTIHDYEKNKRGNYADINLLINISKQCAVSVDWLLRGEDISMIKSIPILRSRDALLKWVKKESIYPFYNIGLYLKDDSMLSDNQIESDCFKPKDVIIISNRKKPQPLDYVIAITPSENTPILFRQLLLEEKKGLLLKPLNSKYPTLALDGSIKIVAVVTGQYRLF